jgi:hypothetical protein
VLEDLVEYQNSGLDALPYAAGGRPIYAAADGEAQELYEDDAAPDRLLLPLRKGAHTLRVQALTRAEPGLFFGVLDVPAPEQPLPVSRAELALGLPDGIYPVFFRGSDGGAWPLGPRDLAALLVAAALSAAWLAALLVGGGVLAWTWRHFSGLRLAAAWAALGLAGLFGLAALGASSRADNLVAGDIEGETVAVTVGRTTGLPVNTPAPPSDRVDSSAFYMNFESKPEARQRELAVAAQEGVKPVALPLPSYTRRLYATRELTTAEPPLVARLYYVKRAVLWPLGLLWLFAALYCLADALPRLKAGALRLRAELERLGRPRAAEPPPQP